MEDDIMLLTAGSRKQQVYGWLKMMWSLCLCVVLFFPTQLVICKLWSTFAFIFNGCCKLLFLCWTHVLWCDLFCAIALMSYKQEARQGRRIRGVLWWGIKWTLAKWKCVEQINGCLFWF
jgi:hypothetical protein